MVPKLSLFVCLIVPPAVFAQNQPSPGAQMQQPAPTVNVVPPQSPSVVVVGGGLYGTAVYPLSYLPMAPSQNTAPQQAGTAGISFLAPSTYSGPGYSYATPIYSSNPASPYYNATPVNPAPPATVAETGPAVVDFGPSYYVSDAGATLAAASVQPSLAEVAAHYRSTAKHAARMYTNADAWRLSGGEVIPGIIAANMPPAAPPSTPQESRQEPSQSQQQPSAGQASQPSSPSQPPSPVAATPSQAPTQPQAAPPQSKPPEESGSKSTLPASSTLLPLLGALGFLSSAVGLWIARHKR